MALALYRKYRPATFAEVVGQEHVTEPLSTALAAGRINHAYLFSGPRGCGKTSSARILARSLNCELGPTPEPCGVCPSCVSLAPGGPGNIDVTELDAASHGGVDDTRELRDRAFFAPAESRYRVFIVDEAHMITTQGFNALLKIVEEPPEHLVFVFATTEPDKVLPTIRSRTHHYPFRLIPPGTLRGLLERICAEEGVTVQPAVHPLVIRAGGGSARDTLSVLDQLVAGAGEEGVTYERAVALLGVTDVALIDDVVDGLAAADRAAVFEAVDRLVEAGHDPRRFAADLLQRLRDLVLLQAVPEAAGRGLVEGAQDELRRMAEQADRLGPATLARYGEILHTGLVEMRGATAPRLLLELLCARMLLPAATTAEPGLLERLERLERRSAIDPVPPAPGESSAEPEPDPARRRFERPSSRRAAEREDAAPSAGGGAAGGLPDAGDGAAGAPAGPDPAPPDRSAGAPARAGAGSGASAGPGAPAASDPAGSGRPAPSDHRPARPADGPPPDGADDPRTAPRRADAPRTDGRDDARTARGDGGRTDHGGAARADHGDGRTGRDDDARLGRGDDARLRRGDDTRGDARGGARAGGAEGSAAAGPDGARAARDGDGRGAGAPSGRGGRPRADRTDRTATDGADRVTGERGDRPVAGDRVPGERSTAARDGGPAVPPPGRAEAGSEEPGAATRPGAARTGDQRPARPAALDAAAVRRVWPEVLSAAKERKKRTAALLVSATVRAVEGDTLVLSIGTAPLARLLSEQSNTDVIAEALHAVLGVRWRVRCEHGDGAPPPARGGAPSAAPAAPQRRSSRPPPVRRSTAPDDGVPLPPEPADEEPPPDDEESMLAEAAAAPAPAERRDPEEEAIELLTAQLGATTIRRP